MGGIVHRLLEVDPDRLSYFEIQDICSEVGAPRSSRYQYSIPGGNLEHGLRLITSNDDVLYMCAIHRE